MRQGFTEVGVSFEPFTPQQAETVAWLWSHARNHALSLADRSCLALAMDKGFPVITTDRAAWGRLNLDIEIRVLR